MCEEEEPAPVNAEYDIVMLVLNDLSFDGRVRREAAALAERGWRVLVIGTQRAGGILPDEEHLLGFRIRRVRYGRFGHSLRRPWRWVRHVLQAAQIVRALSRTRARAFHAHDLPALLLMAAARWGRRSRTRLVYDSHEFYLYLPRDRSRHGDRLYRLARPIWFAVERRLARGADAVITVSEPIARCLAWWYGIPCPAVIHNYIDPVPPAPARNRYLVHTGDLTNRGRCLDELVEALAAVPEGIDLVFLGDGEARAGLETRAQALGVENRVRFVPPVPPEAVAETISDAQAALVLLRPDSWHSRAALPNKLFEAVAAGLPVVASDKFAVRRMVQRYRLGIACDATDPAAIASAIRHILEPDRQAEYREAVEAAQQRLNWQAEAERLAALYRELLP
jgi:glycosyltransferase involved in cell wall biosynthesis